MSAFNCRLRWQEISCRTEYTFECPISSGQVKLTEYTTLYGPFMKTLDGTDMASFVDFFFEPSPMNPSHWTFVDEDAKLDFIEVCQEMNLMPEIKHIQFGDWGQIKKDQVKTDECNEQKKVSSEQKKQEIIHQNQTVSVQNLTKQIEQLQHKYPNETKKITELEQKLQHVKDQLQQSSK